MTQEQFIKEIAKYVQKYAPKYGLMCNSAIIAQACLESSYGSSNKAKYHNYFGLKYRENRVNCNKGYFYDGGSEQNADGSYTLLPYVTAWYAFEDMEHGVEGYCQFLNIANYKSVKGIADPLKYLQAVKDCGYATSLNYVSNVYKVVEKWNLTQYDTVQSTSTTTQVVSKNSPLATYTKISPNKTSPRNHKIDTITIHCYVGQVSVESAGNWFAKESAKCSCNYVIGADGRIGLIVDEGDRSWCTSSASNDNRAITIECASNTSHPYAVNDKVMKSLIELCADICKRNNIKELKWKADKNLIGQVDKQNMTVHRWFKNKACPGEFLYERHGYIAAEVNKLLGVYSNTSSTTTTTTNLYRVRKSWADAPSQTGAYSSLENAKKNCKSGYSVFDKDGNCVYSNVPSTTSSNSSTKLYKIQTGSFALEKNAIALQEKLKKAGFDSIIKKEGILTKVQVGAYSKKDNAEEMKKKLQAKGFNAFVVYS